MSSKEAIPRQFQQHLVRPSESYLANLKALGYSLEKLTAIPVICGVAGNKAVEIAVKKPFDPHIGEVKANIRELKPRTLDELKLWAGVPNQTLERTKRFQPLRAVRTHHLPAQEDFAFDKLEPERRKAVHDTAFNLLYGYAPADQVQRAPYAGVVRWMLERSRRLTAFAAPNLLVCPDHTVTFNSFAVLAFTNVIVVGNGRIKVGSNVKLMATNIQHV